MPCKRKTSSRPRPPRGFTFLEVLVALAVISISIVALLNSHTLSLRQYLKSQILSRATMLAEEKINEIEAKGLPEIDELEAQEYDNGLRYILTEGEFYDPDDTERLQPLWRQDYLWTTIVEETEFAGVRKITVEVFSKRFLRESIDVNPWDDVQVSPSVRLVTYIASTNRREDARSGVTTTTTTRARRQG
jgi:prepilin-type N-terminal cleavage/methylation domain-containing protein